MSSHCSRSLFHRPVTERAAFRCTLSKAAISFWLCGSHALQTHWRFGLVSAVYAVSFTDFGQFRIICPRCVGTTSFYHQALLPDKGEIPLFLKIFPQSTNSYFGRSLLLAKPMILHFEGLDSISTFASKLLIYIDNPEDRLYLYHNRLFHITVHHQKKVGS